MKIYLDIDGVLLKKDHSIPEYGIEFISFLLSAHECFWLSTHCRKGVNNAVKYLSAFYPDSTLDKLKIIKTTDWTDLKTQGIDLRSDFLWLEDYPFESEKKILREAGKLNSLILVDLKRQAELKRVRNKIELLG